MMIMIETDGSWHGIGKQYAEQAGTRMHDALDHYASWMKTDILKYTTEIEKFRDQAATYCPDLIEETAGMAGIGAGMNNLRTEKHGRACE